MRGAAVRTMMKVKFDTEAASRAIEEGSLPELMQETFDRLEPEAAYFGPEGGVRTAFVVFDLMDSSDLPSISERLFSKLKATIEIFPVMNRDDLERGLQQLGRRG
jgi:hypothetical protein